MRSKIIEGVIFYYDGSPERLIDIDTVSKEKIMAHQGYGEFNVNIPLSKLLLKRNETHVFPVNKNTVDTFKDFYNVSEENFNPFEFFLEINSKYLEYTGHNISEITIDHAVFYSGNFLYHPIVQMQLGYNTKLWTTGSPESFRILLNEHCLGITEIKIVNNPYTSNGESYKEEYDNRKGYSTGGVVKKPGLWDLEKQGTCDVGNIRKSAVERILEIIRWVDSQVGLAILGNSYSEAKVKEKYNLNKEQIPWKRKKIVGETRFHAEDPVQALLEPPKINLEKKLNWSDKSEKVLVRYNDKIVGHVYRPDNVPGHSSFIGYITDFSGIFDNDVRRRIKAESLTLDFTYDDSKDYLWDKTTYPHKKTLVITALGSGYNYIRLAEGQLNYFSVVAYTPLKNLRKELSETEWEDSPITFYKEPKDLERIAKDITPLALATNLQQIRIEMNLRDYFDLTEERLKALFYKHYPCSITSIGHTAEIVVCFNKEAHYHNIDERFFVDSDDYDLLPDQDKRIY